MGDLALHIGVALYFTGGAVESLRRRGVNRLGTETGCVGIAGFAVDVTAVDLLRLYVAGDRAPQRRHGERC